MLTHSEAINEIGAALAKAQGEIAGASKSAKNTHFNSKYADLAAVWDAVREPLSKNGLAVVQSPSADGNRYSVETVLLHTSGQWFRGVLTVTGKDEGPQAAGSCITYLRRYALQSFAGVAAEDDDANAAEGRPTNGKAQHAAPAPGKPDGYDKGAADLIAVTDNGIEALRGAFKEATPAFRDYLVNVDKVTYESLISRAKNADARNAALASVKAGAEKIMKTTKAVA
jgi:hypothetical protein